MRRLTAAVALAIALAGAAPAQADLRWSEPQLLDTGAGSAYRVLIDARGDALALWTRPAPDGRSSTFVYAWRAPRGEWTEPRELGAARGGVSVILTPLGRASAAWQDAGNRLVVADARPGRAFGAPAAVATGLNPLGTAVTLAGDDAGNLVTAWLVDECREEGAPEQGCGHSVRAATRSAAGAWSSPQWIERYTSGGILKAAVNPAGAGAISYMRANGSSAALSYRPPGGGFGPPEAPLLPSIALPDLALDDAGRVTLLSPKGVLTGQPVTSVIVRRDPVTGWGEPGELPINGYDPLLAEPDGTASVVAIQGRAQERLDVKHAALRPDGTVEGPTTIAEDGHSVDAAVNLRGDILAAWLTPAGSDPSEWRLMASERRFGGGFSAPERIAGPGAGPALVALGDARQAAAIWSQGRYGLAEVRIAMREDPEAPELPFPPDVRVEAPSEPRLDSDGALRLAVRCSRACTATPAALLLPGTGAEPAAAKGAARKLKARRAGTLGVRFGRDRAKAVRKALRAGRKPWVSFTVRARGGGSPRPMIVSRRVKLR
jgi:hypothetical protein